VLEPSSKIDRALAFLEEDHERQGYLALDDVLSLSARLDLTASEEISVRTGLSQRGIGVREPEEDAEVETTTASTLGQPIHQRKRLSREQTAELSRLIQAGIRAQTELASAPSPTANELLTVVARGHQARCRMIESNLGLVGSVVKRMRPSQSLSSEDLFQEGAIGLYRAAERFDPSMGTQFSTYAMFWIQHDIRRALADKDRTIRIPIHAQNFLYRAQKARASLLLERRGHAPTVRDVADQLGVDVEKLQFLQDIARAAVPLDALAPDESDSRQVLQFAGSEPSAEDLVLKMEEQEAARDAAARLPDKEHRILALRYGFEDEDQQTLQEVGQQFGVSRERIRQLQENALARLRRPTADNPLLDFLERPLRKGVTSADDE
jgi:RNA polymerase primary sigma factor